MWGPTMSDHNWVLENLESYSAGGLNAEERERLEAHLPDCLSCSQALQDIRVSDQQLESLFAPVRPKPGFEDRMISSLRTASARNGFRLPMIGWIGVSAAAAVVVGVVGASVERVVLHGSLLPGRMSALNNLQDMEERLGSVSMTARGNLTQSGRHWDSRQYISGSVSGGQFGGGGLGGGGFGGGGGGSFGGNFAGGEGGQGREGQPVDK